MTLRHFQIFVAVCDTMNMTAAGRALFLSQSAVSQAVAELERHYGARLFERLSRRLYLTPAGETLLGYARHIVNLNAEIERGMQSMQAFGLLRVGASVTVGACVLPKLASAFLHAHPDMRIEAVEDNTRRVERLLLRSELDVGLVEGRVNDADLICRPFLRDELVLVCGKSDPLAAAGSVSARELERLPFIIRETGSGTRRTFEEVMEAHGLSWHAVWTCNNADTIKNAVAEGHGVSVISRRSVENEVKAGCLHIVRTDPLHFSRMFQVVLHKNKYITAPLRTFLDFCAAVSEMPEQAKKNVPNGT